MAKILLVEDDKSLREIYGVRLMAEGYEIVSAGDGEEALAVAIKERPDLIISDVMMPKISGFDMLDILRSTTETKGIKVIMMTALSSEDQRARGESLGADKYLVKSQVGIEDVVRTVHEVLGDAPVAPASSSTADFGSPISTAQAPVTAPAAPNQAAAAPVAPTTPAPAPQPSTPATPIVPTTAQSNPAQPSALTTAPSVPPVINTPPTPTPPAPAPAPNPADQPGLPVGERVINPISTPSPLPTSDIATQMAQELSALSANQPTVPAAQEPTPVPPTPQTPPAAQ